jgi:hypothetical protein
MVSGGGKAQHSSLDLNLSVSFLGNEKNCRNITKFLFREKIGRKFVLRKVGGVVWLKT